MKKFVQEAITDNILESIKQNNFNRNKDVKDFIEALDMITGNVFISLDARWGEGKTFYVRQVEQTLKYLTRKQWGLSVDDLEEYFSDVDILNSINLNYSYLPIPLYLPRCRITAQQYYYIILCRNSERFFSILRKFRNI